MMGAGLGCSSLYKLNPFINTFGGNKKQGLPPSVGLDAWSDRAKSFSIGTNRNKLFFMNQLGGVGAGRSMFNVNYTHKDGVRYPSYPKSSEIDISSIIINGTTRYYAVFNLNNISINNKALLCFPAGAIDIIEFCQETQLNNTDNCTIVFLGQRSYNSYTFQNAFPWLYRFNNNNDVLFVDSVLDLLFNNLPELFLVGKSDGAGFATLYPTLSKHTSHIKGIGMCSGAHFGLDSSDNIGPYSVTNRYKNSDDMIIPYNIIIPKLNIPIFIFHGTGDTTMYYNGANYVNSNAFSKPSLWRIIDPTVDPESTVVATNTYTANIPLFINSIITHNNMTTYYSDSNSNYNWSSYRNNTGTVLNFISLNDQGHCWSGHTSRNASSVLPSNFYMDSTYLLIKFFNLLQGDYKETVNVIPPNLLTYNNTNIV